jgi:hypothetical protein
MPPTLLFPTGHPVISNNRPVIDGTGRSSSKPMFSKDEFGRFFQQIGQ